MNETKLTEEARKYMMEENRTLYRFGNFHLHEDLICKDMVRVFRDGFNEGDKEWHGLKTSAIHDWLTPHATRIPVDAHGSSGASTVDKILDLIADGVHVTSLEASMSGFMYTHPEYNRISNIVYNIMSAGNSGEGTHNIGAVMSRCLAVAAVNIYDPEDKPTFAHCGYSANDVDADTEGKPVDISGAGPAKVMFFAKGKWRTAEYSGTSMRNPYVGSIMTKNGQAFFNAEKRHATYQEINEMLFNFTVDVEPMRSIYIRNHGLEEGLRLYMAKVGFGVVKLPTILLPHWGTWYYSYLVDFCGLKKLRTNDLNTKLTRGQLGIMLANMFADYPNAGMASTAINRYLIPAGIPFKGRLINGVLDMAYDGLITRDEFFVMMRRVAEHNLKEDTEIDGLPWDENIQASMAYLENLKVNPVMIYNKDNGDDHICIGSACAILARYMGFIEWSEKEYI